MARRAGGRCEALDTLGNRCRWPGRECDHKIDPYDHRIESLQWLCTWHHSRKTARESAEGKAKIKKLADQERRAAHPGMVSA